MVNTFLPHSRARWMWGRWARCKKKSQAPGPLLAPGVLERIWGRHSHGEPNTAQSITPCPVLQDPRKPRKGEPSRCPKPRFKRIWSKPELTQGPELWNLVRKAEAVWEQAVTEQSKGGADQHCRQSTKCRSQEMHPRHSSKVQQSEPGFCASPQTPLPVRPLQSWSTFYSTHLSWNPGQH